LKPLSQDAARETFNDITGDIHVIDEVDKVLQLTDNMPLAINLIGHLVESEGCAEVLSRWELEKTSLISEGYDKRYNLDVSISLSLSSPRMTARPHSRDLLSLLSILPDGLSDSQLLQSKLPLQDILGCKATLIRTALAYSDSQKRLRALVPIREYMHRAQPPQENIIQPVLNHFHDLLECYIAGSGSASSQAASQIVSNYSNIQTVLGKGLQLGHQDLVKSIYSVCNLNRFSCRTSRGMNPLMNSIPNILPQPFDVRLRVYIITELFSSSLQCPLMDAEKLKDQGLQHINEFDDPDLKCMYDF
jgi:hypothetical protein